MPLEVFDFILVNATVIRSIFGKKIEFVINVCLYISFINNSNSICLYFIYCILHFFFKLSQSFQISFGSVMTDT